MGTKPTSRVLRAMLDPCVLYVGTIESRKNLVRRLRIGSPLDRDHPGQTRNSFASASSALVPTTSSPS
ncbi:MAG TPA: hypothetical protein VMU18_05425 [Rhodoblastus sp.]|nr:hypothetical protein [Rhodoblastus sp.]